MKKNKQQGSLRASNSAHKVLQNRAIQCGDEQKQIYHGACIIQQEKSGRVLTRAEREKIYNNVTKTSLKRK